MHTVALAVKSWVFAAIFILSIAGSFTACSEQDPAPLTLDAITKDLTERNRQCFFDATHAYSIAPSESLGLVPLRDLQPDNPIRDVPTAFGRFSGLSRRIDGAGIRFENLPMNVPDGESALRRVRMNWEGTSSIRLTNAEAGTDFISELPFAVHSEAFAYFSEDASGYRLLDAVTPTIILPEGVRTNPDIVFGTLWIDVVRGLLSPSSLCFDFNEEDEEECPEWAKRDRIATSGSILTALRPGDVLHLAVKVENRTPSSRNPASDAVSGGPHESSLPTSWMGENVVVMLHTGGTDLIPLDGWNRPSSNSSSGGGNHFQLLNGYMKSLEGDVDFPSDGIWRASFRIASAPAEEGCRAQHDLLLIEALDSYAVAAPTQVQAMGATHGIGIPIAVSN